MRLLEPDGRRKRAFPAGVFMPMYARSARRATKKASHWHQRQRLAFALVNQPRLIASIVRLMMSAWQAFGAQKQTRQTFCFRASAASR